MFFLFFFFFCVGSAPLCNIGQVFVGFCCQRFFDLYEELMN